ANGIADHQEISEGLQPDIDRDSVPDSCEDCNHNGVPDWIDVGRESNMFVGQTGSSVRQYHAPSGGLVQGLGASVHGAYDLVFGPDRMLYVASYEDSRIVRINPDTGEAADFVPQAVPIPKGGMSGPAGLAFGVDGNLYVASHYTGSVFRYDG